MANGTGKHTAALEYQLAIHDASPGAGGRGGTADERPYFKWLCFSLGLTRAPLLFAAMEAERGSITSQIAVQLSSSAVVEKAQELAVAAVDDPARLNAPNIVRDTFRDANRQVYQYAHRMQVGGQVAATGMVGSFDGERLALAKVGGYEGYLWRAGQLIPLYAAGSAGGGQRQGMLQRFIGANSQILVDLATVAVKDGDRIIVSTVPWKPEFQSAAAELLAEPTSLEGALVRLAGGAFHDQVEADAGRQVIRRNLLFWAVHVGRPIIPLTHIIGR